MATKKKTTTAAPVTFTRPDDARNAGLEAGQAGFVFGFTTKDGKGLDFCPNFVTVSKDGVISLNAGEILKEARKRANQTSVPGRPDFVPPTFAVAFGKELAMAKATIKATRAKFVEAWLIRNKIKECPYAVLRKQVAQRNAELAARPTISVWNDNTDRYEDVVAGNWSDRRAGESTESYHNRVNA